jgi:hypothetical protein
MVNDTCYYLPYSFTHLQLDIVIKFDYWNFNLAT